MQPYRYRLNAVAALFALSAPAAVLAAEAAAEAANLPIADVVVVSATRVGHPSFALPAAIDVIDSARIGDGQIRVNASEALAAVPGLVVQNRQNYAQDLQISSRGFGARSAFGVRGVRLISDGIPASMPDGQGQAATFNLDTAERIEVLRGPFSAIYGNHSGGVIQLFSRDGKNPPSVELNVTGGSDGTNKADLNAQGEANGIGYVLDGSRFRTDGFRDHSAARREQAFGKITVKPTADSKLTIVANSLHQGNTQDPLGVTWATFQRDPRAGELDASDTQNPKRTLAERYDTRKSIDHQQLGATWEQRFGDDRLRVMAYGGNRDVIQYQAFTKGFQAPASHSGGVVDFQRDFYGVDTNWTHMNQLAGGKLSTTIGIDYGRSKDARTGYENYLGDVFGLKGRLRRDEQNVVSSLDPYLQAEWQSGPWMLSAGVRYSRMKVSVDDHYLGNGNDSGSVEYSHTTPVLGLLYQLNPNLNVYASAARGFEAPTLNELFYSGSGSGFNFKLKPATSTNLEAGVKARIASSTHLNAAVFQVHTDDELVVDVSSGGRTSYKNASKTVRQGVEVSFDSSLPYGFTTRWALTSLHAVYDEAFGAVARGSRLPGVPSANLFAELGWKDSLERFGAAFETVASKQVYAEDSNREKPAPGYTVFNARVNAKQSVGTWRFKQFARLNNLFDKTYVGSVIVGDSNKRYYEAAPGRNWLLGASAQYVF
ncbi:TonB-dependent receptor [Janthinobacterium sp. PC23-8]|uniref:TonB-dependent receptor family protein n=1 Tax=Janthinobacterium sp. PC23-8 TaxID=2012679 RepID=UPI000B960ECB|nr:TonB-dependent receptor [Janthinobacterium sp. PC23-8]OYO26723.1 TonB-dependent siderophore receptor [Janthinobacterium sp. PC23-8]